MGYRAERDPIQELRMKSIDDRIDGACEGCAHFLSRPLCIVCGC
jgi:hypothetical protein